MRQHARIWLALPLLAGTLALPVSLFAADWPQFRGPRANGLSPETGINQEWAKKPPRMLWRVPLSDDGYAGPSVAGGIVYLADHQGREDVVRALDLRTGKERWRFRYPDGEKRVYGFARATPSVAGGKLYMLGRLGLVHCLDARTGRKLWARDIQAAFHGKRPQWYYSMSPLVDGDRLILCPGGKDASVVALDRHTGKTIWAGGGSDVPGYATPVAATIEGRKQYIVFAGFALLGVDAATGRLLWRFPWETPIGPGGDTESARAHFNANAATPLVVGNRIFIATGYQHGCALVAVSGSRASARWASKEMQAQFSSPVLIGGCLYGTSDPGRLVCLEMETGRLMWRQRGFDKGGLAGVDGTLIVMDSRKGDVVMVRPTPSGYRELGRISPLGGESRTAPVIAEGKLLIRNRKALACVDLRGWR